MARAHGAQWVYPALGVCKYVHLCMLVYVCIVVVEG